MNAMTGSDYTTYPFSTQNPKDYNNLMSVYLDAVFFPKLEKIDFMQEGHRLEFKNPDDTNSQLEFKGVVFNEMKGAMADPSSLFDHRLQEHLYPTTTYHYNSGGEPSDIPNLTYEQLKEFHRVHYHPSNTRFFTYGDLPVQQHLNFINEHALSKFGKIDPKTEVPDEKRFTEPQQIELTGPPAAFGGDPERQTKMCTSMLTNPLMDSFETFGMQVLSSLLLNGPNAPLYKALITSNIGTDFSSGTGYSTNRETHWGVGLMGIRNEDVTKVKNIIQETLAKAAEEGFEKERIESTLHQLEIGFKHKSSNFGMRVSQSIATPWIHGADPIDLLYWDKFINKLREKINTEPFFQNLIEKHLLNNPHQVTLVMNPDPEYVKKQAQQEEEKLSVIKEKLLESQKSDIINMAKELKKRQELDQDLSVLPSITVSDLPRTMEKVEVIKSKVQGVHTEWVHQPVSDLVYFRAVSHLQDLPEELIPYVPLFCKILTEMGTEKQNDMQLAQNIEMYTGGISVSHSEVTHPDVGM
jgi:Zn-dependent M16 (insulinase) family peptidase